LLDLGDLFAVDGGAVVAWFIDDADLDFTVIAHKVEDFVEGGMAALERRSISSPGSSFRVPAVYGRDLPAG
jgi:hypothetical protein